MSVASLKNNSPLYPGMPEMILWLDLVNSPITFNGGDISQLDDLSGQANDSTQGTSTDQPLFKIGKDGLPVMSYDAVSEFMQLPSFINFGLSNMTGFYVYNLDISELDTNASLFSMATGPGYRFAGKGGDNLFGSNMFGESTDSYTEPHDTTIVFSHKWDGTQETVYKDGIQKTVTVKTPASLQEILLIGCNKAITNFAHVDFSEIIMFGSDLSDEQRSEIEQYLIRKWKVLA